MPKEFFLHVGDVFHAPPRMKARARGFQTVEEWVQVDAETKKLQRREEPCEVAVDIPPEAEFVVYRAQYDGGGKASDGYYADGWHIYARQLSPQGLYDENGPTLSFWQEGDFTGKIETEIPILRKMKLTMVPA